MIAAVNPISKARAAWGDSAPGWIMRLAEACTETSQNKVAARLNVSPTDALFIGDSVNDFLAARAACCPVFLLPYGYNEGRDVQELACDAIVPTIESAAKHIRFRAS